MNKRIVSIIKRNKVLYCLFSSISFFKKSVFLKINGNKKKYPKVLQLPITYKCNGRCVMCNIWRMNHSGEADINEFRKFMRDDIFKEVVSVGLNGGEPSLVPNLCEYVEEILSLPRLKSLNIISNGFGPVSFLDRLKKIYEMCQQKNINFHISISLDGLGRVHNLVRGAEKDCVFEKTIATIDEINRNQKQYCDSCSIGCTIVAQNIDSLIELDVYAKSKKYNIKYRLGVDNKRIQSDVLREKYSVIDSPLRQAAKEFFHYQMWQAEKIEDKFKYFSIFYWLNSDKPKRLLGCLWKDEGITLDSRGELYYCAVASNSIGSLRRGIGEELFFKDKNIDYRKNLIKDNCDGCIHDYGGRPQLKDIIFFFWYFMSRKLIMKFYKIKSCFV